MNRQDIIAMAVESGMETLSGSDETFYASVDDIIRFTALVAAKERERLASASNLPEPQPVNESGSTTAITRWMIETPHGWVGAWDKDAITGLLRDYGDRRAAAEREACRAACEEIADWYRKRDGMKYPELKSDAETGASDCESAIVARGQS